MRAFKFFALISILVFVGSANAQKKRWSDHYEPQVFEELPVRVMKPLGFKAENSYPVIISLHGSGGKGSDNNKQLKGWNKQLAEEKRRKEFPCYVVAPQAKTLWEADHLKTIKLLIGELPSVDLNRIYIMGHSMGGHGTYIFIQLDPDYFAAAAPSAGSGLKKTEDFIDASKIKNVPIWAFHGDKDGVCPIEKDKKVFAEMKELRGNMKLTTWAGDRHNVAEKMIAGADNGTTEFSSEQCDKETDFMTWMFSQSRSGKFEANQNSKPKGDLSSGEYFVTQSWSQEKNFKRSYFVNVPAEPAKEKLPVLIFLHGSGGNAKRGIQGFVRRRKRIAAEYVTVFPQGYRGSWNIVSERSKSDDRRFIESIILDLAKNRNVDPNHFTVMGSSNGAALVNQLAIESRLPNIRNYISGVSQLNVWQHETEDSPKGFRRKMANSVLLLPRNRLIFGRVKWAIKDNS